MYVSFFFASETLVTFLLLLESNSTFTHILVSQNLDQGMLFLKNGFIL